MASACGNVILIVVLCVIVVRSRIVKNEKRNETKDEGSKLDMLSTQYESTGLNQPTTRIMEETDYEYAAYPPLVPSDKGIDYEYHDAISVPNPKKYRQV